ncbi:MAG: HAD-IC family P-type ATPase [Candidatus Niyogibacteria bacterium]|nr:MAG: HAD-IC family P-type ATPase [Candidatus Niyogibacteria bacterium]
MQEKIWHAISPKETAAALETDTEHGLQTAEAKARLEKFGPNDFEKRPSFRLYKIISAQIKSPLVFILIIAGFISLLLENKADAAVIFIAVAINTVVGAIQEGRASLAFDQLRLATKTSATVIRSGRKQKIDTAMLVPGDIILVQSGDRIPADSRIIESKALEANEAILTGEWAAVAKNPEGVDEKTVLTERNSMIWMGTSVSEGWGKAVIVSTGEKTELGKIAKLVKEVKESPTPFQKGIKKIAMLIGAFAALVILAIFILGIIRGHNFGEMFFISVAVAVSIIPEGLPVAVTVVLAVGMYRIMRRGGLTRKLAAAETLGSTSIILTDKTGTLTQAKMEAVEIATCDKIATKTDMDLSGGVFETLKGAIMASAAFIENPDDPRNQWRVQGRSTDKALLEAGIQAGLNPGELLESEPRIDFIPFEAERKYSASLHKSGNETAIYIAGAPETLIEMSAEIFTGGAPGPFTKELKEKLTSIYLESAGRGERVLAAAYRRDHWSEIARQKDHMFEKTVFLGLISFSDPLRPDVQKTIKGAKEAGIKIVLLTGDHASTAKSIAESAGLVDDWSKVKIVEGRQIENMSEKELREIVPDVAIFARVLPHQKSAIVGAWQSLDEVVAMTGDGVNDAPALHRADIGIALGSGTDVAKESSGIVLTDDNFGLIFHAIEEGRVILDNLRKIITYLLAANFSEIVLISGALVFGLPLPILPAQILWANIVQEGFMNFAFAFEPKENDVLKRNPRTNSSRRILNKEMLYIILGVGIITSLFLLILFLLLYNYGLPLEELRTIMFVGISLDALFFAFSFKSLRKSLWHINIFSNPYLLFAFAISLILLVGALYFGPIAGLLQVVKLTPFDLGVLVLIGLFNLTLIETAKYLFIRRRHKYNMEL